MTRIAAANILLVEDNPGDVEITRMALARVGFPNRVHVVNNGEEALKFLRGKPPYEHCPVPDLMLLDLNLPRKNGREVLEEVKSDPNLKHLPVVVLTSSRSEEDILRSYRLHANCYVTKPLGIAQFHEVIRKLTAFWIATNQTPGGVGNL